MTLDNGELSIDKYALEMKNIDLRWKLRRRFLICTIGLVGVLRSHLKMCPTKIGTNDWFCHGVPTVAYLGTIGLLSGLGSIIQIRRCSHDPRTKLIATALNIHCSIRIRTLWYYDFQWRQADFS